MLTMGITRTCRGGCTIQRQVGSRYNPRLSIIDNIQLPPTLLSRFDLIYLVLDKADEASDRKLARHLVAMYHATPPANAQVMET